MPNAQLSWAQADLLGVGLLALALILPRLAGSSVPAPFTRLAPLAPLAPFSREAGVIAWLYALWQLAGTLAEHGTHGAFARARWIEHAQRVVGLPSERTLQRPLLEHPWLGQAANIYYATMHFGVLFALLLWVFWRHREHYPALRTAVIGFTGLALLVQLVPVAPPRLLPEFGFTDVAAHYGQSVYGLGGVSVDQLSAMPSVHVGWAMLAGAVVARLGSGPWRYLGFLHSVLTVYVVTATANHWWFDALAAVALLGLVVATQLAWARLRSRPGAVAVSRPGASRYGHHTRDREPVT